MWRTRRPASRYRIAAAVAAALLLVTCLSACNPSKRETESNQVAMDAIAQEVQANIAKRPDVANAEVIYQNNISASKTVGVNIMVKPGAELEPVIDEALRLVWQSKLNPLSYIRIDLTDDADSLRGDTRHVIVDNEKPQLESKYGPRPT